MRALPQTLDTARLRLRPFVPADVPAYAAIRAKPEVAKWLPGGLAEAAHAEEKARELVAAWGEGLRGGEVVPWAALLDDRLVGHCGLRLVPELQEVEVLYALDPAVWGRGLAREAALASRDAAFDALGLDRLVAITLPTNAASRRVMAAIGLRHEGDTTYKGLKVVLYAMSRADFAAFESKPAAIGRPGARGGAAGAGAGTGGPGG